MRDHVQIDGRLPRIDLAAEIVERHEKPRSKNIRLMFNLAMLGIPPDHVLVAAFNSVWVCEAVHQVVAELVGQRVIDPTLRGNSVVEKNSPSFFPSRRTKQGTVEALKLVALDDGDRIVRSIRTLSILAERRGRSPEICRRPTPY